MAKKEDVTKMVEEQETAPVEFRRKRQITLPLISMAHREVLYCEVTGEMMDAPMSGLARNKEKTVPVVPVVDLETGEEALLICSAIIKGAFEKVQGGYVGKRFEIREGTPIPGKRYRALDIFELA